MSTDDKHLSESELQAAVAEELTKMLKDPNIREKFGISEEEAEKQLKARPEVL